MRIERGDLIKNVFPGARAVAISGVSENGPIIHHGSDNEKLSVSDFRKLWQHQ
jgi:hypothetical protein